MQWIWNKTCETFSNMWVKGLGLIPVTLFYVEQREAVMIVTLVTIITIDCLLGAMKAYYCDCNFEWSELGKKFSKKFLLYFFTLLASFILSNAYDFIEWWFYVIGSIILFSEFFSLLEKAQKLGLPVKNEYIAAMNNFIDGKSGQYWGSLAKTPAQQRKKLFDKISVSRDDGDFMGF